MAAGYFELKKSASGQFMFNLRAANHQIILTSETYGTKQAAQTGIESVRKNAAEDSRYTRKVSTRQEPYFVLTATNGQTIGRSEMYSSAAAMESGIASVKANGPTPTVKDLTTG